MTIHVLQRLLQTTCMGEAVEPFVPVSASTTGASVSSAGGRGRGGEAYRHLSSSSQQVADSLVWPNLWRRHRRGCLLVDGWGEVALETEVCSAAAETP